MGSGSSKDPATRKGDKPSFGIEGKKMDASTNQPKNLPKANQGRAKQPIKNFKEAPKVAHKQTIKKADTTAEPKPATSIETENSLEEQEEMSLQQVAAQKYKAFEERKQKSKSTEEQEELSIEQQAIQKYKAFAAAQVTEGLERQDSKQRALLEADALLDAYAPPPAAKKKSIEPIRFYPDSGSQADRDAISCIIPGELYLTNFRGVGRIEELQSLGIRHIVCVNEQENEFADKLNYFNIDNLEDQEDHDAMQHFATVAEFTDNALKSGGAVCFHCAAGISRSSTMIIAYLMISKKLSLIQAFERTYNARRVTWPNRTFMKQLIDYERELQLKGILSDKGPTLSIEEWDKWTACDEDQVFWCYVQSWLCILTAFAQFRASKEACLQDRTASLRGKESAQFLAFKTNVQKDILRK